MIKYKLTCKNCDLLFDSWFASSKEYEKLKNKNLLSCHVCNSKKVEKTLMAPKLLKKDSYTNDNDLVKIKEISRKVKEYQNFIKNNFNYYLKNTVSAGKNNTEYDSSPDIKFMNIFELVSSFPLVNINKDYSNFLDPKISLRINPSDMKSYKNENRQKHY